ncbi:SipW-dependent-type signal peptide-containing protein [Microbacterium sp. NPDC076768]|uniref:SipW-dependent-type signal peptide-containing protein n=1 Tax=Microbacterium sp. NPDC076768 TaxID=3154858 RepID=UPI0034469735
MSERSSKPRRRASLGTRVRVGLSMGLALGLGATGTMALFSATSTAELGAIAGSSLDVTVNGELAGPANRDGTLAVDAWTTDDMLPGESVAVNIVAANNGTGSIPLDVRLNAYTLGTLGPSFRFEIYEGGIATNPEPLTAPASDSYRTGSCGDGTLVNATIAGPDAANSFEVAPDKHRLNIGESFTYCVVIALDSSASTVSDTALLNAQGTAAFIVRATQVGAP